MSLLTFTEGVIEGFSDLNQGSLNSGRAVVGAITELYENCQKRAAKYRGCIRQQEIQRGGRFMRNK